MDTSFALDEEFTVEDSYVKIEALGPRNFRRTDFLFGGRVVYCMPSDNAEIGEYRIELARSRGDEESTLFFNVFDGAPCAYNSSEVSDTPENRRVLREIMKRELVSAAKRIQERHTPEIKGLEDLE